MTGGRSGTEGARRVLLVEDEWLIVSQIEAALRKTDLAITARAATLSEACHLADTTSIEIAILDCNLDGEDTRPLAERLASAGIPVLLVSAYGTPRSALRSPLMEALSKPFSEESLLAALDRLTNDQNGLDQRLPTS